MSFAAPGDRAVDPKEANVPTTFRVAEGTVSLESDFLNPVFDLFRDLSLLNHLYSSLSKHGLRLSDIRLETTGSLGDIHLHAYLFNFSAVLRIRLDKVEIQSLSISRVDLTRLTNVVEEVFRALKAVKNDLGFLKHILIADLHGTLEGHSAATLISRFATGSLERLGPEIGKGVVFYLGADEARLTSIVTLDLSQRITGGLYLRTSTAWDGKALEATQLGPEAGKHLERVFKAVGLEIK